MCHEPDHAQSKFSDHEIPRMRRRDAQTNPCDGVVAWSPIKSLWFIAHLLVAVIGGYVTFRWSAVAASFLFTVTPLCLGHFIGLHRLLVHRSFECPRWLEYFPRDRNSWRSLTKTLKHVCCAYTARQSNFRLWRSDHAAA